MNRGLGIKLCFVAGRSPKPIAEYLIVVQRVETTFLLISVQNGIFRRFASDSSG